MMGFRINNWIPLSNRHGGISISLKIDLTQTWGVSELSHDRITGFCPINNTRLLLGAAKFRSA